MVRARARAASTCSLVTGTPASFSPVGDLARSGEQDGGNIDRAPLGSPEAAASTPSATSCSRTGPTDGWASTWSAATEAPTPSTPAFDELGLQPCGKTIGHHVACRQRTECVGQFVGVDHDRPAPDSDQEHGGGEAEHPTRHTDGKASAAIPGAQLITRAGLVLMRGRLSTTALARPSNASAASDPGAAIETGCPSSAPLSHRRQQRDLSHEVHAQLGGQRGTASASKQLITPAVVPGEPRHVLHHPDDLLVDLRRHQGRTPGHPLCGGLRGGDEQDLGPGQELGHRDGDVTGAGRHVDDQEVESVPKHVLEELLDGLVQHRAPPDHRFVVADEIVHRHHLHPVGGGRHDRLAHHHRGLV